MKREFDRETEESELKATLDAAPDDVAEIDPAEFFDPEEFGFKREDSRWISRFNA